MNLTTRSSWYWRKEAWISRRMRETPQKNLTGITVVVLLHVFFIVYALVTGLARKVVEVIKQPIETKIIEEIKPPPPPPDKPLPPPPPKVLAPPPPFIPPPEVQVQQQPQTNTIAAVSNVQPEKSGNANGASGSCSCSSAGCTYQCSL
ncbi:hypothetical protein ACFS07_09110 [Undibacterium arcticum]